MEDDLNGRQPQWKTTSMEENINGRLHQMKTTSMEDDNNSMPSKPIFFLAWPSSAQACYMINIAKLNSSLANYARCASCFQLNCLTCENCQYRYIGHLTLSHLPLRSSSIEVIFHWSLLPLRSSSIEVVFYWGCLPLRLSSIEVVFHWGCLPLRSSSIEVVFHLGRLLLRSSSIEVVLLMFSMYI